MKFVRFLLVAGALAVLAGPVVAAAGNQDPFSDPLIRQIQARHEQGVAGDARAVEALVNDLERITREQPHNSLLVAYLGSAYTLRCRDLHLGAGKLACLKKGLRLMDQAVDSDPQNPATRFVRAVNNYSLPLLCGRRSLARQDFKLLLTQLDSYPPSAAAHLDPGTRQAIFYYAGLAYKQSREAQIARTVWRQGVEVAPDSHLADKIQKELSRLRG